MKPPVAFTPLSAALRLSASITGACLSRTLIGALHAGVLRRERPGSPNTRRSSIGNSWTSWYTKVFPVPPKPLSRSLM